MPSQEERSRLIEATINYDRSNREFLAAESIAFEAIQAKTKDLPEVLAVNDAASAVQAAAEDLIRIEGVFTEMSVAEQIAVTHVIRKGIGATEKTEDEILTILESDEPDVRQRYKAERDEEIAELNAAMVDNPQLPTEFVGSWDTEPDGVG